MKFFRIIFLLYICFISFSVFSGSNKTIESHGTADIDFITSDTLRLRIDDSGNVIFNGLTASCMPYIDASKYIACDASVSTTEFGYLDGVTSAIQTQIDGKTTNTLTDSYLFLGSVGNVATAVAMSGDVTIVSSGVTTIAGNAVTSAKINDDEIVNADINTAAAISHSKLANVTDGYLLVGSATNIPTAVAMSGDVTIVSSGVTTIESGVIVDADINASAAIDASKLADGSVSDSEYQYIGTLTSNAQDQLDAMVEKAGDTMTGNLVLNTAKEIRFADDDSDHYSGFKAPSALTGDVTFTLPNGDGSNGQVLKTNGAGVLSWNNDADTAGAGLTVQTKSTGYTALTTDDVVLIGNSTGVVLNLFPSTSGEFIRVIKTSNTNSGVITIDGDGSELINADTTLALESKYESVDLIADGTGWYVSQINKKIKFQKKLLTGDFTGAGTLTDLTFSNLEIGKVYRITVQMLVKANTDDYAGLAINHNSTVIGVVTGGNAGATNDRFTLHGGVVFTAAASTVTFTSFGLGASCAIEGNNGYDETWAMLEEEPNYSETDQW